MARMMTALVLLLLAAAGCGDGRLSVEEYAIACGDLGEAVDQGVGIEDASDFSQAIDILEESLDGLQELEPPEELQRLHELKVAGSELAFSVLNEIGFDDLQEEEDLANLSPEERLERSEQVMQNLVLRLTIMERALERLEEGLADLQVAVLEEQESLSPETYEIMVREGCISAF